MTVLCGMIERAEIGPFDVGVALHACGERDGSLHRAVRARERCVLSVALLYRQAQVFHRRRVVVQRKRRRLQKTPRSAPDPSARRGAGAAATKASEDARNDDVVVCPAGRGDHAPRGRDGCRRSSRARMNSPPSRRRRDTGPRRRRPRRRRAVRRRPRHRTRREDAGGARSRGGREGGWGTS